MSISAMKQALDDICGAKLCEINSMSSRAEMIRLMDKAITALEQAIAEAEKPDLARVGEVGIWGDKREWVGFTHEELAWLNEALNLGGRLAVIEAIEAKLKEKNS